MMTDLERELSRQLHHSAERLVPDGTEPPLRTPTDRPAARRVHPDLRWRRPLLVAAAVVAIAVASTALLVTLPGDDTATAPDVSTDGRIAYACALALDAKDQGPVDTWEFTVGDPGPALSEVMGAAGLLGASRGDPDVYGELSSAAADLYVGITQIRFDAMQDGLDRLVARCSARGLPAAEFDTSSDGRMEYVCALALDLDRRPGGPDTWRPIALDGTDPAWFEVDGITGLLGAPLGAPYPPGRPNLSGIGPEIYAGAVRSENSEVKHGLDQLVAQCHDG